MDRSSLWPTIYNQIIYLQNIEKQPMKNTFGNWEEQNRITEFRIEQILSTHPDHLHAHTSSEQNSFYLFHN